ncbi:ABC transporter ATP-binding protein [bacterium]|nr:ABC transporter ATP-binding protein [bacterium]
MIAEVETKRALTIRNLHKSFGEVQALRGVDIQTKPGEIFGIIGPDGAGKTTLMRILCGLMVPDVGDVDLLGFDPVTQTHEVRERIGYMPQRFSLYPDLSVVENLRFFADLYLVSKEDVAQNEPRLMDFSRLQSFRKRKAGALSGGMKQKLALICTLIHTPELLILDEPTFGVDPVSRQEFWTILRDLANDGLSIIVTTAYMDEAQLCDRLALMHHGKLITQGTPDEVTRAFGKRLLEVRSPDILRVRRGLDALHLPGINVHRFGARLHVVYENDEQEEAIRLTCHGYGAELEEIAPSVEDTFVALLQDQGEEAV